MYCQTSRVVQSASGLIFWIDFPAGQLERFHLPGDSRAWAIGRAGVP